VSDANPQLRTNFEILSWLVIGEIVFSMRGMRNERTEGKTCPRATLNITDPTWTEFNRRQALTVSYGAY
jgi:hypothetical protein